MSDEFCRILKTDNGNLVLYYVEPDGNDYILHQIFNFEGGQVDIKASFNSKSSDKNMENAYSALQSMDLEKANFLESHIYQMVNGDDD